MIRSKTLECEASYILLRKFNRSDKYTPNISKIQLKFIEEAEQYFNRYFNCSTFCVYFMINKYKKHAHALKILQLGYSYCWDVNEVGEYGSREHSRCTMASARTFSQHVNWVLHDLLYYFTELEHIFPNFRIGRWAAAIVSFNISACVNIWSVSWAMFLSHYQHCTWEKHCAKHAGYPHVAWQYIIERICQTILIIPIIRSQIWII